MFRAFSILLVSASIAGLAGLTSPARAQEGQAPVPFKQETRGNRPPPIVQQGPVKDLTFKLPEKVWPAVADADVAALVAMVPGSYRHEAVSAGEGPNGTGDAIPELHLHIARVDVQKLDNALYFEISLSDRVGTPFRQGIMHFYRSGGGVRVRMFDFAGPKSFPGSVVGLWLAPEFFPETTIAEYVTNADIPLSKDGEGFRGMTERPYPTTKAEAWTVESTLSFKAKEIRLGDRGFDATGKQMWDTLGGGGLRFKSFQPNSTAKRFPGELLVVDLIPPVSGEPAARDGTVVTTHFTGWLRDGLVFGNSRAGGPDAAPIQLGVPARFISGFAIGLPGVTKGSLRRLVIPPGLAWADVGDRRYNVPPDAWVIFELDVQEVTEATPQGPGPMPQGVQGEAPKDR